MKPIDTKSAAKSFSRLVQAAREYNKSGNRRWHRFAKKESGILLRRVFSLWLRIRLGR